MNVILEFIITLFVGLKFWILGFKVGKVTLEETMIKEKIIQSIDCSLWKSNFARPFFICISDQLEKNASLVKARFIVIIFNWNLDRLWPTLVL